VTTDNSNDNGICTEKHYTPQEAAEIYHVSTDTIYRWFRDEPGVIEAGSDERLHKRKKKMIRIPRSVLERFHQQHRTVKP
jgi:predicted site-specific integrase-resolvase